MTSSSFISRSLFGCSIFFVGVHFALADEVKHEMDGWCLAYEPSELPDGASDQTIPGAFPSFLIPVDIPTLSIRDGPSETGILAAFSKGPVSEWQSLLNGPSRSLIGCTRTEGKFGLNELEGDLSDQCLLVGGYRHYEAAERTESNIGVRISCSNNESVLACRLSDIYSTGWKVSIALPKDSLGRWRDSVFVANDFFANHISDCGD